MCYSRRRNTFGQNTRSNPHFHYTNLFLLLIATEEDEAIGHKTHKDFIKLSQIAPLKNGFNRENLTLQNLERLQ